MVESIPNKPLITGHLQTVFSAAGTTIGNIELFDKQPEADKGLAVERTAPEPKPANSQVKNDYYTGAQYNIKTTGDIIKGTNLDTGREFELDLKCLVPHIIKPPFANKRDELAAIVKELPGEVLQDLSVEATYISHINLANEGRSIAGVYDPFPDAFSTNSTSETLVHELGHALEQSR